MLNNVSVLLVGEALGVAVIVFLTLPLIRRLVRNASHAKKSKIGTLYEDDDGSATEESQTEYSVKYAQMVVCITSALGLAASLTLAILSTVRHSSMGLSPKVFALDWLISVAWVLTFSQTLCLLMEPHPVKRYRSGIIGATSSLILFCLLSLATALDLPEMDLGLMAQMVLNITQLAAAFLTGVASLSIPRRPDVYLPNGKVVEKMSKVSALSRIGFTWPTYLLDLSGSKKTLDMTDLPGLNALTRSKNKHNAFMAIKQGGRLWQRLFRAYWLQFIWLWFLVLVQSLLSYIPRFAVLRLLQILEQRTVEGNIDYTEAWLWVGGLAASNVLSVVFETQLGWVMWTEITIPIRAQLAALIFSKAMRKKDCKEAPKLEQPATNGHASSGADAKKNGKTPAGTDNVQQSSDQGTINLIAVDAIRVAQMAGFTLYLVLIFFRLLFAVAFLWMLVGWKSLAVGLATNGVCLPLNAYFAKRYADSQKKLMAARDRKVGVVTEALQGIRQIKFAALEGQWETRINEVRKQELRQLWQSFIADTVQRLTYTAGPILLAAAALSMYVYINEELTASVAFTALGVFAQLENVLGMIPDFATMFLDAKISVGRIDDFLETSEKVVNRTQAGSISFQNVSVTFPSDEKLEDRTERFRLRSLNLKFPNSELSVISGKTGSGKSLLLAAILGEVDVLEGTISVPEDLPPSERYDQKAIPDNWIIPSSIAFVSQQPWIENASIKDNIIFGLPLDPIRYQEVIESCALPKDLEMLEDGDMTEVGAQGISLSGGQRWRVTFARALYSRAGILVLDDLFSALDAHVGKYIFEHALTGELAKDRTRILVTHHVALCLPKTKYAVLLADGTVERAGMVEELERTGGMKEILRSEEEIGGPESEVDLATDAELTSPKSTTNQVVKAHDEPTPPQHKPKKLVEDETRETGGIKRKIYGDYLQASGGIPFWIFVFFGFVIAQALTVGRSWWIKLWTSSYEDSSAKSWISYINQQSMMTMNINSTALPISTGRDTLGFYLGIYIALSSLSILVGTARFFYIFTGSIRASRTIFESLTFSVLRMPLRWIDTVPTGRILNRFTADFSVVDSRLAHDVAQTAASSFSVIGVVVAGLFVTPYIIILALVLTGLCIQIGKWYLNGARPVKRLESVAKSPIFELFGSALKGISTIRASNNVEVFIERMYSRIDQHSIAFWHIYLFNRWMMFRMSIVGSIFSAAVAIFIVSRKGISSSLAGFALAFSLEFSSGVIMAIYFYSGMELDMNSAERVLEYANLKTETQDGNDVPASWPAEGRLEFKNLVVGYADGLPDILKGLSFRIEKHQRVGIVGRTGAGKSSMTLALFRFLEARAGSIHIDGIDISKVKLHDLRSRLTIIPQDPVLFSGTIRSNMDPFEQLDDNDLREALQRVHLVHSPDSRDEQSDSAAAAGDTNVNMFESLSSTISDGGLNLSQGQRQLLCLARAIVSRPKIMVLDEATSAVDMATDILIQRSIREEFNNTTLIVIAHRLSTISDFDKILVLDDGKAVEFGCPEELLDKKGMFWGMVGDSGEKEKIESMIRERTARVQGGY